MGPTPMWFKRFLDRVLDRTRDAEPEQQRRVEAVLFTREAYDRTEEFLGALLDQLPSAQPLDDASVASICRAFRGDHGEIGDSVRADAGAYASFWGELSQRFPDSAYVHAFHGDTLLLAGRHEAAMTAFFAAFDLAPALIDEFGDDLSGAARDLGGESWLGYQLAALSAAIERRGEETDEVGERYSDLLETYRDDDRAMARIRELGKQIADLTADESLPRTFVRRGSSRPK